MQRQKSQKGVNMTEKKSQKGAEGSVMKRKIYQQLLGRGTGHWHIKVNPSEVLVSFKERFRSEPINDMAYFVTILRYIHQNPDGRGNTRHQ